MRTIEELREGCAQTLKNLRMKRNMSKNRISLELGVDAHTWDKYEKGISSPAIADYIYLFAMLDENPLRPILEYLYPDAFSETDVDSIRETLLTWLRSAPDRYIRELSFCLVGNHGSSTSSQIEMLTAYNHLPLHYRYIVANTISELYEIAEKREELAHTDRILPDLDVFHEGLSKAHTAVCEHHTSYTSIERRT